MKKLVKRALLASAAVAGGAGCTFLIAGRLWDWKTDRMTGRVLSLPDRARPGAYAPEAISSLPAPVRRYFGYALPPGQPLIRTARISHTGHFRAALDAGWSDFSSVQHISADPPAFVWSAGIEMVPLVGVRVRDSYMLGEAGILGSIGAVIPVVSQRGGRELASGALHRYLAESVWLPTSLLPREGLEWEPVDDSNARVTLTDSGITVSLDVRFAPNGEILCVWGNRYRDVNGVGVLTPFEGTLGDYGEVHGMRIPMSGEVAWILPEGRLAYWRATVSGVEYTFTG